MEIFLIVVKEYSHQKTNMVIKSSCIFVWDKLDYVKEVTRQVLDSNAYVQRNIIFSGDK